MNSCFYLVYFCYELVIWSFETFVIFIFRERLFSVRRMNLWIYLNKNLRYFNLEFMSKDYDL